MIPSHRTVAEIEAGREIQQRMLTRQIIIAETIARVLHLDQKIRSTGEPFIMHSAAVAYSLPPELKPAGWLHDTLEDTPATPHKLLHWGVATETVAIVQVVSRLDPMTETYGEFIQRVAKSGNKGAIQVKLADLNHNLRPGCPRDLLHRYKLAIPILEHALDLLDGR